MPARWRSRSWWSRRRIKRSPNSPRKLRSCATRLQGAKLQGLAAGFSALPDSVELAFATATDVPFLEPRWITRLVELIDGNDLAIPFTDGYHHPLAAIYRPRVVLPVIEGLLREDRLRPVFLVEAVKTRIVNEDELRTVDAELRTLRNLNFPGDYESAK